MSLERDAVSGPDGYLQQRVAHFISNKQSDISQALTRIEEQTQKLDLESSKAEQVLELRETLLGRLQQLGASLRTRERINSFAIQSTVSASAPDNMRLSIGMQGIVPALSSLAAEMDDGAADKRFLQALCFRVMEARHAEVAIAHDKTFEWIFEDDGSSKSQLAHWLKTGSGIFWVSGKPGSGKSTLMKFICQHGRKEKALEAWAAPKKLVTAKYFFWNSGEKLQKSQEGLLRSLLHEILKQCPELIPAIRKIWASYDDYGLWLRHELFDAFKTIAKEGSMSARFCFFIDGVDEYLAEPTHSLRDLIQVLKDLTKLADIKICISSRPWTEFRDAFGHDLEEAQQALRLEDLTAEDIKTYVNGKFADHPGFQMLVARDPDYSSLTQAIVEKAQGVFLWVFLVVRSLLDGITNADSIKVMREQLDAFPPDIKGFFQHMIDSVEPRYRTQTPKYFQLALGAEEPLSLMSFFFLDEDFLEFGPSGPVTLENLNFPWIEGTLDAACRRLDACCKGLLEVGYAKWTTLAKVDQDAQRPFAKVRERKSLFLEFRVAFLHRSVKDFLMNKGPIELDSFDPDIFVCKAILSQLRLMQTMVAVDPFLWRLLFTTLIHHAWKIETRKPEGGEELFTLLGKAENVYDNVDYTIQNHICTAPSRLNPKFGTDSFFHLCAVRGLHQCTTRRIESGTVSQEGLVRLLHEFSAMDEGAFPSQLVELLLERYVGLKIPCSLHTKPARTVWVCCFEGFVKSILGGEQHLTTPGQHNRFVEFCRLFLSHGADVEKQVSLANMGMVMRSSWTVRDVIKNLLAQDQAEKVLGDFAAAPARFPKIFGRIMIRPYCSLRAGRA